MLTTWLYIRAMNALIENIFNLHVSWSAVYLFEASLISSEEGETDVLCINIINITLFRAINHRNVS